MSVEYFAYLADASPVPVGLLVDRCKQRGYEVRVLREFTNWSRFQIVADGVVESDDMVCGWYVTEPSAIAILTAFIERAGKELDAYETAGRVGIFQVEVWNDPAAYNVDLEEEADGYEDGYEAARESSSARWYARVSGGGELSERFPKTILTCALEIRGGIFDDPQECQFRSVPRRS